MQKILINFPTRNRPDKFKESFESLINNISDKRNIYFLVKLDEDDGNIEKYKDIIREIDSLYNPNISISIGYSQNKINAINRNISDYDWDILVSWSDDMIAIYKGFEKEIRKPFEKHGLDWCPCFKDIYRNDDLGTMAVVGRKFYDRFDYLYYYGYESVCCDNEQVEVAKLLEKFEFIVKPIIFRHEHPNNTGKPRDKMYEINESPYFYKKDGELFKKRQQINFGL